MNRQQRGAAASAGRTWLQGPGLAVALFTLVTLAGTLGYVAIEGWSLWDAFYMTAITVTTVGYREVHPMHWSGELWTVAVLIGGICTLFYTAFILMALVVEGGLHRRLAQRRRKRMLDELTNHFILCGYGRIGSIIADEFARQGVPYVVVDRNAERVMEVLERGALAVEADASREEVLLRVGIHRARGLIAAVSTDAENVYTVLTARVLRPDLFIIARIENEDAEPKLKRAGADRVISPYQLGGVQMAATALRPAVVDFMRLATSSESLDLAAEQVLLGPSSPLVGHTLREAHLRNNYGVIAVAIKRQSGHMEFSPSPDTRFEPGDQLVVLGHPDKLRALDEFARGSTEVSR